MPLTTPANTDPESCRCLAENPAFVVVVVVIGDFKNNAYIHNSCCYHADDSCRCFTQVLYPDLLRLDAVLGLPLGAYQSCCCDACLTAGGSVTARAARKSSIFIFIFLSIIVDTAHSLHAVVIIQLSFLASQAGVTSEPDKPDAAAWPPTADHVFAVQGLAIILVLSKLPPSTQYNSSANALETILCTDK